MSLINIPTKNNPDQSLVHLIDEEYCFKQSLDIINFNVSSLSAGLVNLYEVADDWNAAYTLFQTNSAKWSRSSDVVQAYHKDWDTSYETVNSLSASWHQEFTVYYDRVVSLFDWYGMIQSSEAMSVSSLFLEQNIPNWLETNFKPINYLPNQKINVFVCLSHEQSWSYNFNRKLSEPCLPNGVLARRNYLYDASRKKITGPDPCSLAEFGKEPIVHLWEEELYDSLQFNCKTCPQTLSRGCNHHGGLAGNGPCNNAYDLCNRTPEIQTIDFSCPNCASLKDDGTCADPAPGHGPANLIIDYTWSDTDTQLARILKFNYTLINNTWTLVK